MGCCLACHTCVHAIWKAQYLASDQRRRAGTICLSESWNGHGLHRRLWKPLGSFLLRQSREMRPRCCRELDGLQTCMETCILDHGMALKPSLTFFCLADGELCTCSQRSSSSRHRPSTAGFTSAAKRLLTRSISIPYKQHIVAARPP
jgi:hypothetical protein